MISQLKKQDINANEEKQPLNQEIQSQPQGVGLQSVPNEAPIQQSSGNDRKRTTAFQSSMQRALSILKFTISFTMLVDVIYGELLCGLTQVCLFNGIESPKFLSQSLLLFMALTFVFLVLTYKFISVLNKQWIRFLKFLLFFWAITLIVFAIVSFAFTTQNDTFNKQYQNFSEITQNYYKNKCSNSTTDDAINSCLSDIYKKNGILIAIFHLVNGVLILIVFAQLVNLEIPDNFRPISTSRRNGNEKSFIIYDSRYTGTKKKKQDKQEGESGPASNVDIENNNNNNNNNNVNQEQNLQNLRGDPDHTRFNHLSKPYN